MRAAIYCRVSTQDQAKDDKTSIPNQIKKCQELCERKGYQVVETFIDAENYVATHGKKRGKLVPPSSLRKDRPGYQRLNKGIEEGGFDVLVLWKWDRAGSGRGIFPLIEALNESPNRVIIITHCEGEMTEMFLSMLSTFRAQIIRDMHDRLMESGEERLASGKAIGGYDRFGHDYDTETGTWTLNEAESSWVLKIYQWYVGGVTMKEISRRLVQNDVVQHKATKKPWARRILQKILRNSAYRGIVLVRWGGQSYELKCPAIVSESLWRAAQDKLDASSTWQNHNVKMNYLLSGLIKCNECGNRLSATGARFRYENGQKKPRRTPVRRYQCRTCGTKSINASLLENAVWEEVLHALIDPNKIRGQIEERIREMKETQEERQEEADKLTAKLEKLGGEREWVITQARKRIISQDDYENQIALLTIERQELERDLSEVSVDVDIDIDPLEVLNEHFFKGERWGELLEVEPDFELQKQTLHTLVDEIIIYPERGELEIRGTFNRVVLFGNPQSCLGVLDWNLKTRYTERKQVDVPVRLL